MDIKTKILTSKDSEGNVICTVRNYYDKYIRPREQRYKRRSFQESRTVVCCFHEDTDPSLGIMKNRFNKDIELYHCFGCGVTGDVIKMHQETMQNYEGRKINQSQACKELGELYGIDLSNLEEVSAEEEEGNPTVKRNREIQKLLKAYTVRDYEEALFKGRLEGKKGEEMLEMLTLETLKLTVSKKQMVEW